MGFVVEPATEEHNGLLKPMSPLAIGTTLLDQFTILELVQAQPGINLYRAARLRYCEVCGVENESQRERCGFCGMVLPPPDLLMLTERPAPTGPFKLPPQSFVLGSKSYSLSHDGLESALASPAANHHLAFGYQSDPGLVRGADGKPNQDSVFALSLGLAAARAAPTIGLFMIADGVGGSAAGQVASRLGIQTIANELYARVIEPVLGDSPLADETVRGAIVGAIRTANTRISEWATAEQLSSGTTLTLALVIESRAFIANIGDSRVYLWRDESLTQVTNDHSYMALLVAQGSLTPEQAYMHPQRNIILRSLGDATGSEPDLFPADGGALVLKAGDQLLLCSDGLWGMVRDAEIAQWLREADTPQAACAQLVNQANLAGGADNISVVVVRVQE